MVSAVTRLAVEGTGWFTPKMLEFFDLMQIGIAVFDRDQRGPVVNRTYSASLAELRDLAASSGQSGDSHPGGPGAAWLGTGYPSALEAMQPDGARSGRVRRRQRDGRAWDFHTLVLPEGEQLVVTIEVTAVEPMEAAAERAASGVNRLRQGLAVFGGDATLDLHNANFPTLLRLAPEAIRPGMKFAELIEVARLHDEYAAPDGAAFLTVQQAIDRARPSCFRRVRTDGTVIDVASDPVPDSGWTISVADVSLLARAEDEGRRRAAMLNDVLESIPHGVCVYDAGKRVVMFNRAYVGIMSGAPVSIGDHLDDVIRRRSEAGEYGAGPPALVAAEQRAFDISRPQVRRRRRPNGTTIDVRTAPLADGGHLSVVSDVTPLMRAEDEVTRRAEELDVMLANIRHGIILWDRDAQVVASNRIAAELLEQPPGMIVRGRSHAEILATTVRDPADPRPVSAAEVAAGAERRLTRGGRVLEWRTEPGPDGGLVSTFTDVTDMHAAAQELLRAKAAAEAANQAKSRFLATMSHELRTPLNAVIGFSDALARGGGQDDPERIAEFAQAINESGRQLLTLVNNILDVARIDAGRFDLSSEWIDLARLIEVCARQVDPAAQAAEVTLIASIPADLPQLRADERRFRQILTQLLSNAVKFTPAGGAVTVTARCDRTGELLLGVTDTGIGIGETDLQRAFEPFAQVDGTLSRPFPGSGLGLYISRALVQAHGGQLLLSSALGKGTTAEIRLPASRLAARNSGVSAAP